MGILSRLKFWKRKKKEAVPVEMHRLPPTPEVASMENIKAKMDLIQTEIDSLRVQNETLNERIKNMEKNVTEILGIAKSEAK